uniref:Uncharacterized protein n=1 Tax=Romanomermis culicivorax TaxID=13658 RepID=A0A915K786_ROMCU
MAQSLVLLSRSRKVGRDQRAVQEEAAIKEYMKRVESYFLRKLTDLIKQKDLLDHQIVDRVCKGINFDPDKALHAKEDNVGASSPILAISKLLDDAKFERLIEEMNRLFDLNLNISECRRAIYSDDNPKHSVLPSLEPDSFAINLERDLATTGTSSPYFLNGLQIYDEEPRKSDYNRSKSIPSDVAGRNSNELSKFARSRSEVKNAELSRKEPFLPIEPKISILNETKIGIDDSGSDLDFTDGSSRVPNGHSRQRTSSPDSITIDQNEHDVAPSNSISAPIVLSPSKRTRNRPLSSMSHKANHRLKAKPNSDQISLPDNKNISTLSLAGSHTNDDQCKVTAFSFGDGYLTRPIDVCALPNALLAVSDSCGGVYITTRMGHIVHRILVEGGSASSVGFSHFKQLLFVDATVGQSSKISKKPSCSPTKKWNLNHNYTGIKSIKNEVDLMEKI